MILAGTKRYLVIDTTYDGQQRSFLVTAWAIKSAKMVMENRLRYLVPYTREFSLLGEWEFQELKEELEHFEQVVGEAKKIQLRDLVKLQLTRKIAS